MFTGPKANQMFDSKSRGESQHENEQWKEFALLGENKQLRFSAKEGFRNSLLSIFNFDTCHLNINVL